MLIGIGELAQNLRIVRMLAVQGLEQFYGFVVAGEGARGVTQIGLVGVAL